MGVYERCRLVRDRYQRRRAGSRAGQGIVPLAKMRNYTQNYQRAGGTGDFSSYYTADPKERFPASQPQAQHRVLAAQPGLRLVVQRVQRDRVPQRAALFR